MSWPALRIAALISVSIGALSPLHAQTSRREPLVVRSYDNFGVSPAAMRIAERDVVKTFDAAGIDVEWKSCEVRRVASRPAPCADIPAPRELLMRIVAAPRTERDPEVVGFSYVDAGARRGTLGTVYMDRIATLAYRLRAEPGQILGRAIAHEVAHLLLGTTGHSSDGVMRPHWLQHRHDAAAWSFSLEEAVELREALSAWPAAPAVVTASRRTVAPFR
jgi:hypothetical protein